MTADSVDCRHARLQIGGDPHELPASVAAHLATCAACTRFREETLLLDGRLRAALEVPLPQFRKRAPVRRYALAASVALALFLAGGFWALQPRSALANEVVAHVLEEGSSWDARELLPAADVAGILKTAGVEFDAALPVIYGFACPFRGHRVPHFVVQTRNGPMTVLLLAHEKVPRRTKFAESGLRGELLPAGSGSVAVLMRKGELPDALTQQIVSAVRWR